MQLETTLIKAMEGLQRQEFLSLLRNLEKENDQEAFKKAIIHRCATDIQSFTEIFFGHYMEDPFNQFHHDTFTDYVYLERRVRRASGAPRGYAKSTIKALVKPIHDICYKLEKFILIVSNTEGQSAQKAKDISAEFLTNNLIINYYGKMLPTRKVGAMDFIAVNGDFKTRVYAVGSKTEIRGIRFREARPSKIICDDVEHSTEVENEFIREKYEDWYKEVISKVGDKNTNIEFIGTVLHQKSLLKSIIKNPKYKSREYKAVISWAFNRKIWDEWKAIYVDLDNENRQEDALSFYRKNKVQMDEGTKVLWPEREPYYFLQEEIIETGIRAFMKEKQNDPLSDEEKIFNQEEIWYYEQVAEGFKLLRTGRIYKIDELEPIGVIDPSSGQVKPTRTKKSDFTCILSGFKDPYTGRVFVHQDFTKRVAPTQYIKEVFELHLKLNYYRFGIETNLFRGLLKKNIIDEKKRRESELGHEINISWRDIVQTENKEKRIYTIEPKVSHGYLVFNKYGLSQEFWSQMFEFPKANHDDCPDSLEMLWSVANNKYETGGLSRGVNK